MKLDKDGNPVGNRRPPVESQFRPGQSGNPKGRPKGSKNVSTRLKQALAEKVPVKRNGRIVLMTKLDAAVEQLANKCAQGELRATLEVFNRLAEEELRAEQREPAAESFTEIHRDVLVEMQRRMSQAEPQEPDNE